MNHVEPCQRGADPPGELCGGLPGLHRVSAFRPAEKRLANAGDRREIPRYGGMDGRGRLLHPRRSRRAAGPRAVLFSARGAVGPRRRLSPGRNKRSGSSLIRQGPCARSPDTEEEGETRGLNARLREQSALCSEVTRRGAAGEGAQGLRLRRRRDVLRSLGLRGAGTGLRSVLLGGRCGRGVPRPCSPSPEPPPPSPESECYIKSRVGTTRGVASVAPTRLPSPPAALDTE